MSEEQYDRPAVDTSQYNKIKPRARKVPEYKRLVYMRQLINAHVNFIYDLIEAGETATGLEGAISDFNQKALDILNGNEPKKAHR